MEYTQEARNSNSGFALTLPGLIIAAGFVLIVFSTFLDFTPICQRSWRAGGVGLPVMLSCMIGTVLALRRSYFSAFFIGIFAAFFLTHEIVIIYDNHAVELGQELKPDGWFRSVIQVYFDALQPGYGAFWGFIGATIASLGPLVGLALEVRRKNLEAAEASSIIRQTQEGLADDSVADYDSAEEDYAEDDYDSSEDSEYLDSDPDESYQSEDEPPSRDDNDR